MGSNPFLTQTIPAKRGVSRMQIFMLAAIVLLGGAFFGYLEFGPRPVARDLPLTADAKGYVRNLQLADVGMKASVNYFSQKVVEIEGKIGNGGDRPIDVVEVYCVFRDAAGQVLLRERAPIVNQKMGGLKPGETKSFRLPFDKVPDGWNQEMPHLVIAGIDFS
ncbi:MAG: FxLYD domain-containing protein [Acidobacteriota bacterium]